ncbi:MAG: alanine racemase [candidate division Zixibacteria bacterium]|nr:alanine racemase [candidate division Zixibacteria bacterium]
MAKTKTNRFKEFTENKTIDSGRPSYIEIDLDAFSNNFNHIKKLAGRDNAIMAVVKANAYGHGIVRISRQAEKLGADYLGVAFIEEAEKLLETGIKMPIVILYPDLPERAAKLVKKGLIATVGSADYLEALNRGAISIGTKARIFIKAETGMGRYGVDITGLKALLGLARQMDGLDILGICTNLADSSNGDDTFTRDQFAEFTEMVDTADWQIDNIASIENSSGLLFHHTSKFNLVRVGLLMYGFSPKARPGTGFKPVMSLKSRIIQLKNWPAGKPVGYGGKFIPRSDIILATIGIGYADGYPWTLSNKSHVLVNGLEAPVVGKICMDAMMIDVTDVPDIAVGDEVVLIGGSGDRYVNADYLADLAGSFVYELISGMSDRLPRIYKGG